MLRSVLSSLGLLVTCVIAACGADTRGGFATQSHHDAAAPATSRGDANIGNVETRPDTGSDEDDACAKMDIVFVIDNSASMQEEQTNLANNFALITGKLDAFTTKKGAKLDYRIAVTTTGRSAAYTIAADPLLPGTPAPPPIPVFEPGDDGAFRSKCSMTRPWLERADPNVADDFSCIANVGVSGPSLEMPLQAARLALSDRIADGKNGTFLRHDALLATVFLTDEDDCSRGDNHFTIKNDDCKPGTPGYAAVGEYVQFLDSVKGGRARWATAVIAGEKACESQFGSAEEALRLKEFVAKTGPNAAFSTICAGDLTTALESALATFDTACRRFSIK